MEAHTKKIFKDLRILQTHQINEMQRCEFFFKLCGIYFFFALKIIYCQLPLDTFLLLCLIYICTISELKITIEQILLEPIHIYSRSNAVTRSHGTVCPQISVGRLPSTYLKHQ